MVIQATVHVTNTVTDGSVPIVCDISCDSGYVKVACSDFEIDVPKNVVTTILLDELNK